MPQTKTCGKCGAEIAIDALFGLCRSCLFDFATKPAEPETAAVDGALEKKGHGFRDYQLGRQIGRGGMGVVYEATQFSLPRQVALKMILDSASSSSCARWRFIMEAETVARLDHPNIVPIYEMGEHLGQPFLSMKLIEGEDLRKKIASGDLCLTPKNGTSRTDVRERAAAIARIIATTARAVHHAHIKNILHRDLKPANILVDRHGQPHLTDFGLAKQVSAVAEITPPSPSNSGDVLGTPSYMSSEQAAGQRLTAAADVYSLGAILYEMLTGEPPFKASTPLELFRLIAEQEPKTPSSKNPRIDKDLDTVCLKCLQKNPSARYATAEALAEDLERWLKNEPIFARPVGPVGRTVRWIRRNPAGASLIASLCACLAVSLVLLLHQIKKNAEAAKQRQLIAEEIRGRVENAWADDKQEKVVVSPIELAILSSRPMPAPHAKKVTFAIGIASQPDLVASQYGRFLGELGDHMGNALGEPVNFELHLYKASSWALLFGARKGADVQGVTPLTYVRMRQADPGIEALVQARFATEAVIFARSNAGIATLMQTGGKRLAFAHTNSIISFLGKVEFARAGLCQSQFSSVTNLFMDPSRTLDLGSENFAHREVLNNVLTGRYDVGLAPFSQFNLKRHHGPGLVELCRFTNASVMYVARAGLSTNVVRALRDSLVAIEDTALLDATRSVMREGFKAVTDSDFDPFRKLITNEWRFFETCQTNSAPAKTNAHAAPAK